MSTSAIGPIYDYCFFSQNFTGNNSNNARLSKTEFNPLVKQNPLMSAGDGTGDDLDLDLVEEPQKPTQ